MWRLPQKDKCGGGVGDCVIKMGGFFCVFDSHIVFENALYCVSSIAFSFA